MVDMVYGICMSRVHEFRIIKIIISQSFELFFSEMYATFPLSNKSVGSVSCAYLVVLFTRAPKVAGGWQSLCHIEVEQTSYPSLLDTCMRTCSSSKYRPGTAPHLRPPLQNHILTSILVGSLKDSLV